MMFSNLFRTHVGEPYFPIKMFRLPTNSFDVPITFTTKYDINKILIYVTSLP